MRDHYADGELTRIAPSTSRLGSNATHLTWSFRSLVQQVFTALLSSTVKEGGAATAERTDIAFLRVLRAFLSRAASWSPSLLELRAVLATIFSAYIYEKSLLSLANCMLDRDLFVHVDEVTRLRQRGWRPRGQACEICRHRIWGPGVGGQNWEAWEKKQEQEHKRRATRLLENKVDETTARGKGKAAVAEASSHPPHPGDHGEGGGITSDGITGSSGDGAVPAGPAVVFSCRHLYHRQCLLDHGQTRPPPTGRAHHFPPDGGGWEMSCPACT
ncbi:hypothetical protein PHISP_04916 [Aspergillus sp. HF37]|nr:hypothetical protein PHISP_04916 [Aspergillus sp. HF37]